MMQTKDIEFHDNRMWHAIFSLCLMKSFEVDTPHFFFFFFFARNPTLVMVLLTRNWHERHVCNSHVVFRHHFRTCVFYFYPHMDDLFKVQCQSFPQTGQAVSFVESWFIVARVEHVVSWIIVWPMPHMITWGKHVYNGWAPCFYLTQLWNDLRRDCKMKSDRLPSQNGDNISGL